jgi:MSHA biogenesis protein MshQ
VPGETAAPGTATGKTGTPIDQAQGISFDVTVNAVDANWYVISSNVDTVAITSSDVDPTLPGNAALVNGTGTFSITLNTVGTATITVKDITAAGVISANTSPSINVYAPARRFNTFEHSTAVGATTGVIKTKLAGTAFSLDIIAIKVNGDIDTSYNKTVTVELMDASDNTGAIDAQGCLSTWATIKTLASPTFTGGRITVLFAAENDAWLDARIKVSWNTQSGCSGDNFAIRPDTFSNISVQDGDWQTAGTTRTLNNTGASVGPVHKAGRPFSITATAINGESTPQTTTNYTGSPAPNITAYIAPATAGTFTIGASAVSGVMTSTTATYDDVGSFTMQLEDLSFADVDISDSTTAERYIISSPFNVGRFVPDHFDVAVVPGTAPQFATFCASGSFTYIGQPFGYATLPQSLVTAKNYSGTITGNYTDSLQKIADTDVTQTYTNAAAGSTPTLDSGSIGLPTIIDNDDGTITVTQAAAGTLEYTRVTGDLLSVTDVPFDANISLDVSVTDYSEAEGNITSSITATFNGSGSGIVFDSGNEFRYGLLTLANNFGPETEDITNSPFEAQYYDGTSWVTNTDDSCTTVDNFCPEAGIGVGSISSPLSAGQGTLTVTKPTSSGTFDVCPSQDTSPPWLTDLVTCPSTPNDTCGQFTFGIYRGNDRIINWREIVR